jgi:phage N-6-adenine-methyltransferase
MIGHKVLLSKKSDEWITPPEIIFAIEEAGYNILYDLAATEENAITENFFSDLNEKNIDEAKNKLQSVLKKERDVAFCNPPYSKAKDFVKWCVSFNLPVILLLPARTDTRWFHEWLYEKENIIILFLKGRLRFSNAKFNAPFPSLLAFINC